MPLVKRRKDHVKQMVGKCLQDLAPNLFAEFFLGRKKNQKRCDIVGCVIVGKERTLLADQVNSVTRQ